MMPMAMKCRTPQNIEPLNFEGQDFSVWGLSSLLLSGEDIITVQDTEELHR
jgi:hypothetical protein